ncbi:MAG: ABC transporter ATP-binding protein [Lachnospiraceae bacterium]|nr:ABC transporter ATP-binding protein [Lachnospiraceae bacterium]MDD7333139.1 ABC transporter ATP-binding protein [Lachnospiraceae bacterium]MDY3275051.1 ABC transporter ATP-binding protein [Agathobacter sp.]MDY5103133.1 ABC transporter ATP-binding protein [Agathobacter sp.]MDY5521863.1 ABC transporter ATP-binding protein [Agathobacter sp.]
MSDAMIQADGLVKIYKTKQTEVLALQGLDLTVEEGELTALIGNSGSGKSTFLNMIGGLDRPSAGSLMVCGKNLFKMSEKELVAYKRDTVGFVWQNNGRNLLPYLSVLENIMLPMNLKDTKKKKEKALELLDRVGLSSKKNSRMNMMSGGEQQRVAIAIALANSPKILLADEPTGSVDTKTADMIFDIFTELNREGQTILIVTHDVALSKKVKRVVAIRDGKISSERILKEKYADRLKEITVDWRNEETQEEYVIVDKVGRVQIPREILDHLSLKDNKVKLEFQDGKVVISAPEELKGE